MNDFARTQLMKYGWSEGKGLGKHESGITQALRPKLKFDTAGIGHNKNGDYNNWWENAFNKAANNISVRRETNGGVSISTSGKKHDDDNGSEEKNSKSSVRQYGNFLKSSVLLDGNLIEDVATRKTEDVKEEDVSYTPLTDDELFRICGGRTGHKGARHGLTLNGKLKRIARQEEALLNTSSSSSDKLENNNNDNVSDAYERVTDECAVAGDPEGVERKVSKTVKRNTRRCINLLSHKLKVVCNLSDDSGDAKGTSEMTEEGEPKRKKKKKRRVRSSDGATETKDVSRTSSRKRSKKEVIKNNSEDCPSTSRSDTEYVTRTSAKKRKKLGKKKKKQEDEFNECPAKKFKKSDKDGMMDSAVGGVDFLGCRENFLKESTQDEINDDDLIRRMSTVADRSNRKLRKKKLAKRLRKERIRVENITKTLEAVHFNNRQQQQSEVVVERCHKKRSQGTGLEKAIDSQTQCDG